MALQKQKSIACIGSTTVDILFYTNEGSVLQNPRHDPTRKKLIGFEQGAKLEGNDMQFSFGGGAANAAITFGRMRLRPEIITAIGSDVLGRECMDNFKKNSIPTSQIKRIGSEQTSLSFIVNVGTAHDHTIFVYRGASRRLTILPHDLTKIKTSWLYVTTLSGEWRKSLNAIVANVASTQKKFVWNPGAAQIDAGLKTLKKYLASTYVLIVNQDEATELLLKVNRNAGSFKPARSAQELGAWGPQMVVVTCGHKGSYLFDGKKVYYQKAIIKRTINKTGAGDAFGSGLVTGLIYFNDIRKAMRLAAANSSAVVQHIGAQNGILKYSALKKI